MGRDGTHSERFLLTSGGAATPRTRAVGNIHGSESMFEIARCARHHDRKNRRNVTCLVSYRGSLVAEFP
jgi:hypothetical protein